MTNSSETAQAPSVDRRSVIKGAAAGMAAVWTVPLVSSITSPAYAAGSVGNPDPACAGASCSTFIPGCSADSDCICTTTFTGGGFCVPGTTQCLGLARCADGNCPPGSLCVVNSCCGENVCVPVSLQCAPSDSNGTSARRSAPQRVDFGPGTLGGGPSSAE